MEVILNAIENACISGVPFVGVLAALTIPDIAGAVDNPGTRSQARYAQWVDSHFLPHAPAYREHGLDGFAFYALRCKLLHEGLTDPSKAPAAQSSAVGSQKRLVAFNFGPGLVMHLCSATNATGDSWTILRAETFCNDLTRAARAWMHLRRSDAAAAVRLAALVDIRTDVPPLSAGIPLICAAL